MIKLKKLIQEWKLSDPEFQGAKEIYHGQIFTAGEDYFFTVKDKKLWKFEYGHNDKKHPPYVKLVKKVSNIKFPTGDNDVEYDGKTYGPLGDAWIYKLKSGKFLWEF